MDMMIIFYGSEEKEWKNSYEINVNRIGKGYTLTLQVGEALRRRINLGRHNLCIKAMGETH